MRRAYPYRPLALRDLRWDYLRFFLCVAVGLNIGATIGHRPWLFRLVGTAAVAVGALVMVLIVLVAVRWLDRRNGHV